MTFITHTIIPIFSALAIAGLSAFSWMHIARFRDETVTFLDETVRFNKETMQTARSVRSVAYELVKYQRDLIETLMATEPVGDSAGLAAWAKLDDAVKRFETIPSAPPGDEPPTP